MKKSVAVISLLAVVALFLAVNSGVHSLTGYQILDLPEPPPVPGMESDQVVPNVTATPPPAQAPTPTTATANLPTGSDFQAILNRLNTIEGLLPGWEQRLNAIEAQVAMMSNMAARLDAMQSQIDALRVDVDNLKSGPNFDAPAFFGQVSRLEGKTKTNTILSVSLSVLMLVIVGFLVTAHIVERKKEYDVDKHLLKNYLINYQKAGYKLDTLRMHLRACGWTDDFVNEVIRELPK